MPTRIGLVVCGIAAGYNEVLIVAGDWTPPPSYSRLDALQSPPLPGERSWEQLEEFTFW